MPKQTFQSKLQATLPKTGLLNKTAAPPKRKGKKRSPVEKRKVMEDMFANYFFGLSYKKFVQLTKEWNEENLEIKIPPLDDYDSALNYFKKLSPNQLKMLAQTGLDIVGTEAYAALARWHDIISNPGRIDKIHKAAITTGKGGKTIVDHAKANDRLAVLESIRDQLAQKLQQGSGSRDTGVLSAQMMEVMTQIDIQTRKLAPKAETALGGLLADMGDIKRKRPSKNGGGARHTSFASRIPVTLEDLEANE
jgi:hypothetical protein